MRYVLSFFPLLAPSIVVAEELDAEVKDLIRRFVDALIDPLVIGLFALAFLLFMWGLLVFMLSVSNNDTGEGAANGKRHMLWGLLGMVVMFSVAGIINIITSSIGDTESDPIKIEGGFE